MSAIEPVPDAAHARHEARRSRFRFDLLAQVQDVGVDDTVAHVRAVAPRVLDELFSRQHAAAPSDEGGEQAEFECGRFDTPARLTAARSRAMSSSIPNGFVT